MSAAFEVEESVRDTRRWGLVWVTLTAGWLLTMTPDRGAWWALHVIGTVLYWPSLVVFVWWVAGDACRWLRDHTLRHVVARLAYWGTCLGPIWWLCLAGLWWVTGVFLGLLWIVVFVTVDVLVDRWLEARREEKPL